MDESSEDAIVFSLRDAPKICQVILVHNSSDFHVIWFYYTLASSYIC